MNLIPPLELESVVHKRRYSPPRLEQVGKWRFNSGADFSVVSRGVAFPRLSDLLEGGSQ